jgi:acetyl esterase
MSVSLSAPDGLAPEVSQAQAQAKAHGVGLPNVLTTPIEEVREQGTHYHVFLNQDAPPVARVVEHRLDHLPHPVTVRLYYPDNAPGHALPAYLHIHGGGFAQGNLDTLDRLKREIAREAGVVTVGIEYALSPEHRYPVALTQVVGALRWLRDQAGPLGLDATRLAVGGESAGGNLTLSSLVQLRDAGEPFIRFGAVIYGMLSTEHHTDAHLRFGAGQFGLSTDKLEWFWKQYLVSDAQRTDPGATPLHANLHGLPPLLLQAAALDPLLDDTLVLAHRLADAGIAHDTRLYPGVPHSFLGQTRLLPQAREARDDLVAALRHHLA